MRTRCFRLFLSIILTFVLAACGGGDGGEENAPSPRFLSGRVEDGPISGARIILADRLSGEPLEVCGMSGIGRCETVSDAHGEFLLRVSADASLEGAEMVAVGGQDAETGVNFAPFRLRASLELFAPGEEAVVSPLTSLLSAHLDRLGDLGTAEEGVRNWLELKDEVKLAARPSGDPLLLGRALTLTKIALEMQQAGIEGDCFERMAVSERPLVREGKIDPAALTFLDEKAGGRVADLFGRLQQGSALAPVFKRTELSHAFAQVAERMLEEDPAFDAADSAFQANLGLLADAVLSAAGSQVIPLDGVAPGRIARYVLFSYGPGRTGLAEDEDREKGFYAFDDLAASSGFADQIEGLSDDRFIPELASIMSLYSVRVPLLEDELLGDPEAARTEEERASINQRRLEYFYNSDISPFYFAERLANRISDDAISDPIMLEIALGKAGHGLWDEALALIETQVFRPENQAEGYRGYANHLIAAGRPSEAIAWAGKAETVYKALIAGHGAENVLKGEIEGLSFLSRTFREAGAVSQAQETLDYLWSLAPYLSPVRVGNLIISARDLAEVYRQQGEHAVAAELVDDMYLLAVQVQENAPENYLLRFYYLLETAEKYVDLGLTADAGRVYDEMAHLRSFQLTRDRTMVYVHRLARLLYRLGRTEEAYLLADGATIPSIRVKALQFVATEQALTAPDGLQGVVNLLQTHFPDREDRIEGLTYFSDNPQTPYVGLAYIEAGRLEEAAAALLEAARLVEDLRSDPGSLTETDLYKEVVHFGYVKIARLYRMAGLDGEAEELLFRAADVLATFRGVENLTSGYQDIARIWHELGDRGRTAAFLQQGADLLWARRAELEPGEVADLYHGLVDTALDVGADRDTALPLTYDYLEVLRPLADPDARTDHLIAAAEAFIAFRDYDEAHVVLEEAVVAAGSIIDEVDLYRKFVNDGNGHHIIGNLARAGRFERALELSDALEFSEYRNLAYQKIAAIYSTRDDLPGIDIAHVDTDGDGLPDFFSPSATTEQIAQAALSLDPDMDGDGVPDSEDHYPLSPSRW